MKFHRVQTVTKTHHPTPADHCQIPTFQTERTGTMAKRKVKMNGLWTVDKDQYPQEIIHRWKQ